MDLSKKEATDNELMTFLGRDYIKIAVSCSIKHFFEALKQNPLNILYNFEYIY